MTVEKVRNALKEFESEYQKEVKRNSDLKAQYRELEKKLRSIESAIKNIKGIE